MFNADVSTSPPTVSGTYSNHGGEISVTHVDEPLDLGQVPFALGGTWSLHGTGADQCTAAVKTGSVVLDCANLRSPLGDTLQSYDYANKKPLSSGTSTAQRGAKADSIFGELGGTWSVSTPAVTCQVTFQGSQISASCTRAFGLSAKSTGTMTLSFADGVVTGTTNAGELTARRR